MILDAEARSRRLVPRPDFRCLHGRLRARGRDVGAAAGQRAFPSACSRPAGSSSSESQDVYKGETAGQPYYPLDAARLRFFGGSSNHWGGWTRPLDPYDFKPKASSPERLADRQDRPRSLRREASRFSISRRSGRPTSCRRRSAAPPGAFPLQSPHHPLRREVSRRAPNSGNIRVHVNANLVDLRLDAGRRTVSEAVFRSYHRATTRSRCRPASSCSDSAASKIRARS